MFEICCGNRKMIFVQPFFIFFVTIFSFILTLCF